MGNYSIVHWLVVLVVFLPVYVAPSLVALARKHDQLALVVVVNLLLGWTCLGWLFAVFWAASGKSNKDD